ncbi:transcriptional regulator ATRX-like [Ochlerotatus camptorhynchus]|uniref:transcriptional regulator ATRX-like n=1 Tax=Ochlerotatus camptorhynchus TaxID=644619 RepID=UPI0031D8BA53
MATAVEEPDLFNGLEITEMDEINMDNGDEYVFIPSDNENEDENGSGSHVSLISQSVFNPTVASGVTLPVVSTVKEVKTIETVQGVPGVGLMDTESDQLLVGIGLDSALVRTASEARVKDGEMIIVKRIDLTEEDETVKEQDDQRFTVSYDFNLDMQQLLNIEQAEEMSAEVTIKEEMDIEEAVVNLPDDEETGFSEQLGSQLDLVDHDEHIVGSEVITLDSDAAESENEEDCVMMSLLEQWPISIKEEGPDEDRTPVENDHAYTSQPLEDQTVPDAANVAKPDATIQALVDISKRFLEEVGPSRTDLDETLKSIASIEEQLKSLKDKLLQIEKPSDATKEGTVESPLPPLEEPTNAHPSRKESSEMDALSVELSENCSERLECSSVSDLPLFCSDVGEKGSEIVGQEAAETNSATATAIDDTEEQLEKKSTSNLSKILSQNASEPLEHESEQAMESDEPIGTNEEPCSMENEQEAMANLQQVLGEAIEEVRKEAEEFQQAEDVAPASAKGVTNQEGLKIESLEDLIAYGEMFTKECGNWLDKINSNCRRSEEEEGVVKESSQANKEQFLKAERFMGSLTKDVQRLALKVSSKEKSRPDRVEVSVQTEKIQRTGASAKTLNEKYKKRLLSSLGETEVAEQGLSDSDGESYVSNDGSTRSSDAGDSDVYDDADDDEDEAAFERRQNRRKSKRLRQQLVKENETPNQDGSDEDEVQPSKKRNARRLGSTDSSHDKADSPSKSSTVATLDDSEEIAVKNEPYVEIDSESPSNKSVIHRLHNGDDSVEAMDEDATPIKRESSINLTPSQSQSETIPEKLAEENDESSKERREDDGDEQSDSELLDDVLGQVDDILLDVNDILPAAEGVVQDFLVEEEVRTEQEEERREPKREEIKRKPKSSGKKIDSEEEDEVESDLEEKEKEKTLDDMTESELEEYYDNQREKEIDKLCNLANLEVARNAYPQKPQEVKKKPVVVKKKERVIDDILNEVELHHESDDSDSDTEVLETEELFLQKCNENMKNQLLNQLSSSDTERDSGSEDSVVEALKQEGEYDSDDSAGSILMEKFLKSLDKNHDVSGDEDAKDGEIHQEDEKIDDDMDSSVQTETIEADKIGKSEKDFIDDSDIPEVDNEEAMEKMKNHLNNIEQKKPDHVKEIKEKEKPKDGPASVSKTTAIDPIDKQLFSKKMFREVDETLRKDREQDVFDKENGSLADRSERIGSDDSDVELLDVSMFQPKRKMKERKLEDFDFSANTKRSTQQTKRGNPKEGDCISLSSESEAEVEETTTTTTTTETDEKENKQRKIRTMLTQDQLADETKTAQKDEEIRLSRLKKKNENLKKFLTTFKPGPEESNLVLDYDAKVNKAICVHPEIVKLLKPHQKEGIRFMYDNTYGSVEYINKNPGSGCILAHCMGLGKTLQLITLLHTVMRYPQLRTKRVLVICPKSTVMNWSDEIQQWLGSLKSGPRLKVFYFPDNSDVNDKLKVLSDWYSSTASRCGCMLIGYEAFRILVNYEKRKRTPSNILAAKAAFVKKRVDEYLLNPGADLVICDEGHQIKNKKSAISGAVSQIKTKRRIVLTGTPIQNNLKEYYCMVNFIKPSFLGSDREFSNLYGNPIKNGQHKDSDSRAIKIMKQRSYVLHNKLSRFVQRREAGVLKEFLPEKFEYVLFVPLTPVQEKMYEVFLQMNEYTTSTGEAGEAAKGKKFKLLADYTSLRKIWTHPKVLEKAWETAVQEKSKRDARFRLTSTPDSDDDRPDDYNDISSGALSVTNDWWRKHLEANDLESLYPSGKLRIMFEILKQCHERGEKCLIFSAFVAVLNVVEHFMNKIHNRQNETMADVYGYSTFKGPWEPGKDYYRLDGKTQKNIRHRMITSFNDPSNKRTKCFLISAKAGGQGINLIGANRVIILDTSWNPSNDQQNIFRIFRLGQKRKCFVYRLLAMGTMEEKVYSRSVTKQAMSFRVVDEQQIDRHYSFSELAELYNLSKLADQVRETPILPADDLLASLLRNHPDCAFKYHEHDSLLENKPEQDLSEEDKREAWAAYEREIQNNEKPTYPGGMGMLPNFMSSMFPGGPGAGIGPYPPINYSGLPGTLADMYRSDFGYGSGMNRLMYPYGSPPFPIVNDPSYSSIMGKSPYQNFSLPGSSSSLPDFGLSAAMNGQGSAGTTNYNSTVALQSLLDLYAKSMSNAMSSSTITTAAATSVSPSTSTSAAGVSPYNALSSLKQFNGFPPISPIATPMPHSSPQLPPPKTSQSPSSASGNAALINMLNEQPMPMSSAASSGPFSHLNSPLPAPSIHIPRNIPSAVTTTSPATSSPVLSTSSTAKAVPLSSTPALIVPQPPPRASAYKPPESSKSINPKPVPLTTTIVASDDDDVDDDGIPRPHIIVRDPLSINASSSKSQQDQEKIVKKINMGIVYPEEKKKDQSKDIMLSAKSITNLAKPTIAVKNVESMKAVPPVGSKTSSPVSAMSRPGSSGSKPIRASPVQNPLTTLPKPHQASRQHQHQHPLIRTPLSGSSPVLSIKQSPSPRQQVPVITSAKSLQLSSPNLAGGSFSAQTQRTSTSSNNTSSVSPTPNSTVPRGVIAAQQLRELQQRMNQAGANNSSSNISSSSSNASNPGHLVVARTKKAVSQLVSSNQRLAGAKQHGAHPIGIFASPPGTVLTNQKQTKPAIGSTTTTTTATTTTSGSSNATAGRMNKSPLSDSVSITKITSAGQRIAMSNPPLMSSPTTNINNNNSLATMSPTLLGTSLGRKQDLVITKTTPGAATVRKVIPGPNMVVKAHSGLTAPPTKRNFPSMTPNLKSGATTGSAQLIQSISSGGVGGAVSLPAGITSNSITVRKRKATEPTLIDSLKAKNNSITISEVRSIFQPPVAKKPNQGLPVQAQKRFGSGITITPRKPTPQQQQQNILEVVEIE